MARKVTTIPGVTNLPLPNGLTISATDTVVVSDSVWQQILNDDRLAGGVRDLGSTTDAVTAVPSWRDVQRLSAGTPVVVIPAGASTPPAGSVGAIVLRKVS